MSLYDTLNQDKPEPSPILITSPLIAAVPAPAVVPAVTLVPTAAGEDTEESGTANNPKLSEERQDHLRRMRHELTAKLVELGVARQSLEKEFKLHIPGHLHVGNWDSIWPLTHAAWDTSSELSQGLVIFGGWHRQPPTGTLSANQVAAIPRQLKDDLASHYIFCEAIRLMGKPELLKPWVDAHPKVFIPLVGSKKWTPEKVGPVARTQLPILENRIRTHLLFMKNRAFIFYPTSQDPLAGWSEFIAFGLCYQSLSSFLRNDFGPYFFLTHSPSGKP